MLPETAGPSEKEKMGAIMLSAMQVEKGVNKGRERPPTWLPFVLRRVRTWERLLYG